MSNVTKQLKTVGLLSIIAGIVLALTGGVVWGLITSQLAAEKITVSADAPFLGGDDVNGPFSAYAQAEVINKHALAGAENMTYAQLGAKINEAKAAKNDSDVTKYTAMRVSAMNGSFLRASLFTSVLAYGVCAFAIGMGAVLAVYGWTMQRLAGSLEAAPVTTKA